MSIVKAKNRSVTLLSVFGVLGVAAIPALSSPSVVIKANNTDALSLTTSWAGGVVPGSGDIATWDSTFTIGGAVSLGADLNWLGLSVQNATVGFTVNNGNVLALGASGISINVNKGFTFNNAFALSDNQSWAIGSGTTIFGGGVNLAGKQLTLLTGGTPQFKSDITGGGSLIVLNGNTKFSSGSKATSTAVTIMAGGVLIFDSAAASAARMASLTLNGGRLSESAASNANEFDQITGALNVNQGASTITMVPNGARYSQLEFGSLVRTPGATVLFAGTNLGVNTLASQTLGAANIKFDTAPSLVGGGGAAGTTTLSLLVGAYGDTTSAGTGFGATGGLVTYDANGVRLLNKATEYKSSITNEQTQLDNILLSNTGGSGIATTTLTVGPGGGTTTVNSLSFNITGTTSNGGIIVTGDPGTKLIINSGMIDAAQLDTSASDTTNAIILSVPILDLNGHEGIFLTATSGLSSTRGGGALEIDSVITNDGGNGITIGGTGVVKFKGTASNTYTGITTVDSGVLILSPTAGDAVAGDIVVNGGSLEDAGNHIADSSNITVNGGAFKLQLGNEGSAHNETFNNLTMTGGSYVTGASNHSGLSTINGTATLSGGAMSIGTLQKVTVAGLATFSGGTTTIGASNSAAAFNTSMALNGGLAITNTSAGAYTPITINGTTSSLGGELIMGGDVAFTGNSTNTNSATIDAPAATNQGVMALNGTRTFNIGDGAAAVDLTVVPTIIDGTSASGVMKTGLGTLKLSGANTYTAGTTVSAGQVTVGTAGSLGTGSVHVLAGASLELDGSSAISDSATFTLDNSATAFLNYVGTETVGNLVLNGIGQAMGTYGSSLSGAQFQDDTFFSGTGVISVPEPTTLSVVTLGGLTMLARRRRKNTGGR